MDKYVKNFIICGDIDHYCLLCQELFQSIPDVEKHIRWEKHRKSLKNQAYFPRFRRDFIYKIANNFYCELCNFVVSNITAVTEHLTNDRHKTMKNNPKTETKNFIGHHDSGYVVINKVILNMAQWNSIVYKKCLLCNIKVQNISEHIALEEHIIKLIQSETNYGEEPYYRKINEDKYHCFNCKKAFTAQNFNDHRSICENIDENEINKKKLKEVGSSKSTGTTTEDEAKVEELKKNLIGPLLDFFLIDEKNNFASCKYCKLIVAINFMSMLEHMKIHHDHPVPKEDPQQSAGSGPDSDESSEDEVVYREVIDYGKRRSELAKYGKENSIKLNYKGSKGWCLICDCYFSASKKVFKQHIKGAIHRGNLELQGLKSPKKHVPRNFTTKSILKCKLDYIPEEKLFYINNMHRIDMYSFFLLGKIEKDPHFMKTKCYACNELFPQGQERQHCDTPKHKNNFIAAKFVKFEFSETFHDEFIREIRANFFHCGICNKAFPFMEQVIKHVKTYTHDMLKEEKTEFCEGINNIKIKTKCKDVYMRLLYYGFGL